MIRIGIIDSGIDKREARSVAASCSFPVQGGQVIRMVNQANDELGHGSQIAAIITAKNPSASLLIAKVFFNKLVTTPTQVVAALDWLLEQEVRLINLSFGLRADRKILELACQRAQAAGVILVAASPARGNPVYPASYKSVIRACGDARCEPGEISCLDTSQADFGGHVHSANRQVAGASVGCAYVSAALGELLANTTDSTKTVLMNKLKEQADYLSPEHRSGSFPF